MYANNNKNTAKYNNKNQSKVQPMGHTKVPAINQWNNSIFIPAIPFAVTKNHLKEAMESNLGKVHRIDFATFNSDNGSGRRAFVHFDQMHNTDFVKVVRQEIAQKGHFDVSYHLRSEGSVPMNLRIMMNKNPVPETDKTIHQVASEIDFMGEKHRIYEETFLKHNELILDLLKKNEALEEENKATKQYMENMFYKMESLEALVQTLVNHLSMPMQMPIQPIFMHPMMPMPMPTYYQIPTQSNIVEEDDVDYEEIEEDTQGEMHLSELV